MTILDTKFLLCGEMALRTLRTSSNLNEKEINRVRMNGRENSLRCRKGVEYLVWNIMYRQGFYDMLYWT